MTEIIEKVVPGNVVQVFDNKSKQWLFEAFVPAGKSFWRDKQGRLINVKEVVGGTEPAMPFNSPKLENSENFDGCCCFCGSEETTELYNLVTCKTCGSSFLLS
jgi:hypothetical protein